MDPLQTVRKMPVMELFLLLASVKVLLVMAPCTQMGVAVGNSIGLCEVRFGGLRGSHDMIPGKARPSIVEFQRQFGPMPVVISMLLLGSPLVLTRCKAGRHKGVVTRCSDIC